MTRQTFVAKTRGISAMRTDSTRRWALVFGILLAMGFGPPARAGYFVDAFAGSPLVTGTVWLQAGTYTVVFNAGTANGAALSGLTYLLGYPKVRNYDGSWCEWGNLVKAPIAKGA